MLGVLLDSLLSCLLRVCRCVMFSPSICRGYADMWLSIAYRFWPLQYEHGVLEFISISCQMILSLYAFTGFERTYNRIDFLFFLSLFSLSSKP